MTERGIPDAVLKSGIMGGSNSVMRIEGPGGIGLRKGIVKLHMDLSRDTQQSLRFNRVNQEVLLTYHLDATLVEKTIIPWLTKTKLRQGLDPLRSASFGPRRPSSPSTPHHPKNWMAWLMILEMFVPGALYGACSTMLLVTRRPITTQSKSPPTTGCCGWTVPVSLTTCTALSSATHGNQGRPNCWSRSNTRSLIQAMI